VRRADLVLVCEDGGHLSELEALRPAWESFTRVWVTRATPYADSLLRDEQVVHGAGPTTRSTRMLVRNLWLALRLLARVRPRAVLTTGAGLAVPFAWVARLAGIRVVYVECGGRADRASLSCRLVAPVADRVYVQWPELLPVVRGSRYAGRVPLRAPAATPPPLPATTFVTVGTCEFPFDRLLRALDRLPCTELVVAQTGVSEYRPRQAVSTDFMPCELVAGYMREARTIVTHAGVGSIQMARACGKRPIVVARRADLGEHVDDHQVAFARRLAAAGLITLVEDPEDLPRAIAEHSDAPLGVDADEGRLAGELQRYLVQCTNRRRGNAGDLAPAGARSAR
jgi:UDP-N-acetylglucosamine transferase subunit ALG13